MPHGTKPYGRTTPDDTIFGVADMGELAVRLGSPVSHDRRGNVMWFDNFESGVGKWLPGGTGVGWGIAWDANRSRNDGFSMQITTGNLLGNVGFATRRSPFAVLGKIGLEVSIALGVNITSFTVQMQVQDGVNAMFAQLRYLTATQELQVNNGVPWQTIDPALILLQSPEMFHTIKLVADYNAGIHDRVIANDQTYITAPWPCNIVGAPGVRGIFMTVTAQTAVAASRTINVDDVILTQNEP